MTFGKWVAAMSAVLMVCALVVFALSPYFAIQAVSITGNEIVSTQEIAARLGVDVGRTNILTFRPATARRRLMENLYIGDVSISRVLPDRMYVTVSERRLAAYVEHVAGRFLYLDDFGRVLEIRSYMSEPLPLLEGLGFTRFVLGEILMTDDAATFNVVVHYAQLLVQYELIQYVTSMNVADPLNIRIIVNNQIEFNVGSIRHADEKVRTIGEVLSNMPNLEFARGFMDLSVVREEYIFTILR